MTLEATRSTRTVRRATSADVAAIVGLVERAYRGEPSRAGWTTEADLLDGQRTDAREVEALLEAEGSQILLGLDDGVIVATAALTDEGDALYFGMFAVEPTRQGLGWGGTLLAEAERRAREAGLWAVRMTVIAQRAELIAYYRRRGYQATGDIAPFPYGDPRFGQPKRDDLYFVVLEKRLT